MKTKSITDILGVILFAARIIIIIVLAALAVAVVVLVFAIPFGEQLNNVPGITIEIENDGFGDNLTDFLELFGIVIGFSIAYLVVTRLIEILRTIGQGVPFEKENGDRLGKIAKYLVVGQIMQILFTFANLILPSIFGVERGDGEWHISLTMLLAAAIAAVLAEVFREGARLREEQEYTV